MNKIYFASFFFFLSTLCYSQKIKVVDQYSLSPIEGVLFTCSPTIFGFTDIHGEINATIFQDADSIKINIIGFHTQLLSFSEIKENNFTISMVEKNILLDEIVLSASKFEENENEIPQKIHVLSAKDIRFLGQQTTADVLQSTGNVLIQKSQMGGGSPIIRGFEANKVLMVLDGVRLNNAIYRGGHLQNIISMDNNTLEKIEIVFGPGSVTYGSDALGGVMHFFTKNPILKSDSAKKNKISGGAFLRQATANSEITGNANVNFGFKKIGFFSNVTFSNFGDLKQGSLRNPLNKDFGKRFYYAERINGKDSMVANKNPNIQKFSGYKQYDFLQKILYKKNQNQMHILNFQYSTTSNIPRYDRLSEYSTDKTLKNAAWYYGPQKRMLTSYTLQIDSSRTFFDHARFIIANQNIEESRHNRGFNSNNLNHRTEKVNVLSANLDLNKVKGIFDIKYGVEYTRNQVNSSAVQENINSGDIKPLDTRYPGKGSKMQTIAAYASNASKISDKIIFSQGIRYSSTNLNSELDTTFYPFPFTNIKQKSSATNGQLGLVYNLAHDLKLNALISSGFRAPNVDDVSKVFESTPGKVIVPNSNLKPEYTYNAEIGISKIINNQIKLESTAYYTWCKNIISTNNAQFNGQDSINYDGKMSKVISLSNNKKGFIYGLNAGISAEISKIFSFVTTINYTHGRIKTDSVNSPLDHIPPIFGKLNVVMNTKKLRVEFFVLYNGWKKIKDYGTSGEDNEVYATSEGMPAWYTLNLRSMYTFNQNIQLQIALENILDQNYRVFASGISAPGRNLMLTLRGSF